jgi:transposase
MKKEIIRREAIKFKDSGRTYKETTQFLKERFDYSITKMTLIRWMKRLNTSDWDLRDISQRPNKLSIKFSEANKEVVCNIRKKFGYDPKKTRIQAQNEGADMSISTVKRIIKQTGLSKGGFVRKDINLKN